ncbi:hypothetical protein HY988_04510 [Candidatus Micrarchaeota archaeon]|nr:hypothetical protein [Candidatus Micrarchaeota archaeon]
MTSALLAQPSSGKISALTGTLALSGTELGRIARTFKLPEERLCVLFDSGKSMAHKYSRSIAENDFELTKLITALEFESGSRQPLLSASLRNNQSFESTLTRAKETGQITILIALCPGPGQVHAEGVVAYLSEAIKLARSIRRLFSDLEIEITPRLCFEITDNLGTINRVAR